MKRPAGFIAIMTVLVFMIVATLIGVVLSLTSRQLSIGNQANSHKFLLDQGLVACFEKALLQLAFDDTNTSTGSVVIPRSGGATLTCSIVSIVASPPNWNITIAASASGSATQSRRVYTVTQDNLRLVTTSDLPA